jgi:hypothetical protein
LLYSFFLLHLTALERGQESPWESPTQLYAISYRGEVAAEQPHLEVWPHALSIGEPLPELPLWLEPDLWVPLRLAESYAITCGSLRMRGCQGKWRATRTRGVERMCVPGMEWNEFFSILIVLIFCPVINPDGSYRFPCLQSALV